jgi:hypothetical protein
MRVYLPLLGVYSLSRDALHFSEGYTNQQVGNGIRGPDACDGNNAADVCFSIQAVKSPALKMPSKMPCETYAAAVVWMEEGRR